MLVEVNRDGVEKYVVSLRGPYDGTQVGFIHYPQRNLILTELLDEETREMIQSVEVEIDYINENKKGEEAVVMNYVGEMKIEGLYDDQVEDLLHLTAWWISESILPRVWLDGKKFLDRSAGDEYKQALAMVKERRSEDFLAGDEVALIDGFSVQLELMDLIVKKAMLLEVNIRDENGNVAAWIEGGAAEGLDRDIKMEVFNWGCVWEDDDPEHSLKDDALAFLVRYLMTYYQKIEITQQDLEVKFDEIEVAERTYYWLGF